MRGRIAMIAGGAAMLVLWVYAAVMQYNDPDRWLWIGAYAYAAVVTVLAMFGRHTPLPVLGFVAYLVGFLKLLPALTLSWWQYEEGREAMGLLVATIWMLVLLAIWWWRPQPAR